MEHRYLQVAGVPEELSAKLRFLSASQVVAVTRERASLDDCLKSTETSYYVTDLSSNQASPKALASYICQHWNIENQSHWVRDRVFDEDRSQVRVGGAPQVLAALEKPRDLAPLPQRLQEHRLGPALGCLGPHQRSRAHGPVEAPRQCYPSFFPELVTFERQLAARQPNRCVTLGSAVLTHHPRSPRRVNPGLSARSVSAHGRVPTAGLCRLPWHLA